MMLETPIYPDKVDVLCGKDKTYAKHPGNVLYRNLIHVMAAVYADTPTKQEKMRMTADIVNQMRAEHGSRFLKCSSQSSSAIEDGSAWEEISVTAARDKTSHALRFCAAHHIIPSPIPSATLSISSDQQHQYRRRSTRRSSARTSSLSVSRRRPSSAPPPTVISTSSPMPHQHSKSSRSHYDHHYHHRRTVSSEKVPPVIHFGNMVFDDYRSITAAASPEPVFSTGGYPVDDATAAMPYTHNLSYVACPDMVKSQDNSATPMPTYSMSSAPDQEEDLDAILREPLDWEVMEDDGLFFL